MRALGIIVFIIVLVWVLVSAQAKDKKIQCNGKNPYYASMGKMFACDNYRGDP